MHGPPTHGSGVRAVVARSSRRRQSSAGSGFAVVTIAGSDGLVPGAVVADRDLARLGFFRDRDDQSQDAVAVTGLDPIQVQVVPEDELPAEHAARAFRGEE